MYYPYLRARQFELIAIRELASEKEIIGTVMPILEPVKKSLSSLHLAYAALLENNLKAFLIVNPIVGEQVGDTDFFLKFLSTLPKPQYIPAFHYTDNVEFIRQAVEKYKLTDCLLICFSNFSDTDVLRDLCAKDYVKNVMVYEPHKYRSLDRFLKGLGKTYIRLDDVFEKQTKNADFLEIPAHKFSEEHLFYKEDQYSGFSDFTVLSSEFNEGGSTPRAVVIHLTYLNQEMENQIWIRHFTSHSNDSIANVQGKFAEAAEKALSFCNSYGLHNSAIEELSEYFLEGKYPGLGIVKKVSIKNHLLIVSSYLK
jgi:hypothetical protein